MKKLIISTNGAEQKIDITDFLSKRYAGFYGRKPLHPDKLTILLTEQLAELPINSCHVTFNLKEIDSISAEVKDERDELAYLAAKAGIVFPIGFFTDKIVQSIADRYEIIKQYVYGCSFSDFCSYLTKQKSDRFELLPSTLYKVCAYWNSDTFSCTIAYDEVSNRDRGYVVFTLQREPKED